MSAEQSRLPELFERFLKASVEDLDDAAIAHHTTATEILIETCECIAARLVDATPEEIEQGLHVLWRMTRHISREDCWWQLREKYLAAGEIRSDVREWLEKQERLLTGPRPLSVQPNPETQRPASRRDDIQTEWQRRQALLSDFMRRHYLDRSRIVQNLRIAEDDGYWKNYWFDYEIGSWDEEVLRSLMALAPLFQARVNTSPLFWAVFGAVTDAMAPEPAECFADRMEEATSWMLATRIQNGRADLCDFWLALEREEEDERRDIALESLIGCIDQATSAECEDFFRQFDLEHVGDPAAERQWPIAEELWRTILNKQDLSLQLLARGGRYYWSSSLKRHGPSEALAACGADTMFCVQYDIHPFLLFWAAARAAAAEQRWDFSVHCLTAALLDVALRAPFFENEGLKLVEDERFDVRFVPELYLRFKEEIDSSRLPLRECLTLALESLRESALHTLADLPRALGDIGRRVGLHHLQAGVIVLKTIGADVRGRINPETWGALLAAELAWLSHDYTAVGVHYRRALENEWREKAGPMLSRLTGESFDRSTPVKMARALKALTRATITRAVIVGQMGPNSPLLQRGMLDAAIDICDIYLNEAAHARGLDREQCEDLRRRLLADGLLRRCLLSVQARASA